MNLAAKLAEVMGEVGYVQKDAVNEFHHYKYASAEAVLKKVNAALSERGIAVATQAELLQYDHLGDQAGKAKTQAVVRLSLSFTDGETTIVAQGLGEGSDTGDKAVMKANTAAVKYALADAFMISWGDDPEADVSTDEHTTETNPFTGKETPSIDAPLPPKGTKGINAVRALYGHAEVLGWTTETLLEWVAVRTKKIPEDLTAAQAKALLKAIKEEKV
jgi:hypothetical protein